MAEPIYLDHNATTPVDPRVLEAMWPCYHQEFGNPASRQHRVGQRAAAAVDHARGLVALALGADPREIVWTSGATEANNLALKGVAAAPAYRRRKRIVTVRTEHKAVLDPCAGLAEHGFEVVRLGVDALGHIDLEELAAQLDESTLLVSVMHGNNETGVLHPIAAIGALCKERGVLLHTDATQTVGKELIDVESLGVDLLSLSAHKVYGPQGVGVLFVRRKGPRVRLAPQLEGGGHERGARSGTLNLAGIVGLGKALELADELREEEQPRLRGLRDTFEAALLDRTGAVVNGDPDRRLAGTTNLSFPGCDAESLLRRMERVCASSSSACTSAALQPSYVLKALGLSEERVTGSVRFSLGRTTTETELTDALIEIEAAVARERDEGPIRAC